MSGMKSRRKGHDYERQIRREYRELGWSNCETSRFASKMMDDRKIDLVNTTVTASVDNAVVYDGNSYSQRICVPGWTPRIVETVATTGQGIDDLVKSLLQHGEQYQRVCSNPDFMRSKYQQEFLRIYQNLLMRRGWQHLLAKDRLQNLVQQLIGRSADPYTLAEQTIASLNEDETKL